MNRNAQNFMVICSFTLALVACSSVSYDQHDTLKDDHLSTHEAHKKEEHELLEHRLELSASAEIFSCHLEESLQQCREYPIPKDVQFKTKDLAKGCESMPKGKFQKGECPKFDVIAKCESIMRNNHDAQSLVYRNLYYKSESGMWNEKEVSRVCQDLEGKLVLKSDPK
ncbi:hypothetical protein [Pleionea sediminis]|uniref:hypothetical protein n=1 Tax=Pleionea sediminis TaxID=2569479 RepID=UPI0011867D6A|nr:hypothetical protein [Pleionea sediminis]